MAKMNVIVLFEVMLLWGFAVFSERSFPLRFVNKIMASLYSFASLGDGILFRIVLSFSILILSHS